MIRGKLYNARLGTAPRGHILIDAQEMATPPLHGPTIIVGLPPAIETGNDVRYPIAVFGYGYHGILCSPLTRMCGLVSMADVVPTALQWHRPLRAERVANPMLSLTRLEARIETSRAATFLSLVVVMSIVLVLGFWRRRAAACGVLAALLANLALGAGGAGGAAQQIFLIAVATAFGGAVGPRLLRNGLALGLVCVGVLVAYTATMAFDPSVLSLATMGPELTARFYGVSNLIETLLLVPALLGAKLLGERFGPVAFLGVAALALAAVAENRLGADGGGAIVLGVAFAALGVRMVGRGVGAFAGALVGAAALVYALVALDAFAAVADPYLREELLLPLWVRFAPPGRPAEAQRILTP